MPSVRGPRLGLIAATVVAACASPADRFDARAAALGLQRTVVDGAGFHLATFANDHPDDGSLRIYLDGDGSPYLGQAIAFDPTPHEPLVLDLLARDDRPAVYLGRPCYHGETGAAGCPATLWTTARYGEAVVASMTAAAARLIARRQANAVTWVGHSGGGTLAMLIAPRIPQTRAVVTIGANLNVAAWASYARQDLSDSLDPATAPPLSAGVRQCHFAGGNDAVVPPRVTLAGLHGATDTVVVMDGFDHICCWAGLWPTLLNRLDAVGEPHDPPTARPLLVETRS